MANEFHWQRNAFHEYYWKYLQKTNFQGSKIRWRYSERFHWDFQDVENRMKKNCSIPSYDVLKKIVPSQVMIFWKSRFACNYCIRKIQIFSNSYLTYEDIHPRKLYTKFQNIWRGGFLKKVHRSHFRKAIFGESFSESAIWKFCTCCNNRRIMI